jgi:hypothetical protein
MRTSRLWIMVAVPAVALGLVLLGLTRGSTPIGGDVLANTPVRVEPVEGTGLSLVTLTAAAAKRIDIKLSPVRDTPLAAGGIARKTIPYSALLYDADGDTWVFVSPKPLTFIRQRITVEDIDGNEAVLSEGPAAGTEVVEVGEDELWGAEEGVGGE